jgi:glucose-1-phosphate thymidylyltransferase
MSVTARKMERVRFPLKIPPKRTLSMNVIFLVAGYATRLYPLTRDFPKPLLPIGGRAILDRLLDDLATTNTVTRCAVVTNGKFAPMFRAWGAQRKFPIPIEIVDNGTQTDETRLGAVNDLALVLERLDFSGKTLVAAGDNLLDFSLGCFLDYEREGTTNCLMRYYEPDLARLRRCGVLELGEGDLILSMEEKPIEPKSHWCAPPFYIYRDLTLEKINRALHQGCGSDAPGSLAAWFCRREPTRAFKMPGKRYDIGTLESYRECCRIFEQEE